MDINTAIARAFRGQEVKDVKHHNHSFHIKPIAVRRSNGLEYASGQISHDIRFRPDDQVKYKIVKKDEVIQDIQTTIDRGGLGRLLNKPAQWLVGTPIPDEISDAVGTLIDGKWEGSARDIIMRIAIRL